MNLKVKVMKIKDPIIESEIATATFGIYPQLRGAGF